MSALSSPPSTRARALLGLGIVTVATAGAAALAPSPASAANGPVPAGFAFVDGTALGPPQVVPGFSTAGKAPTVQRTGTGASVVYFAGLPGSGTVAHVRAIDAGYCQQDDGAFIA